jgi:pimeloyl-ACP methyl ester carboxylesterase
MSFYLWLGIKMPQIYFLHLCLLLSYYEKKLHYLVKAETTKWQYINGTRNPESISPDNWIIDQARMDRPGNAAIQLAMLYDYKTNLPLYPQWQENFRKYQPPTLIVWGKNDYIFPESGAHPYKRLKRC